MNTKNVITNRGVNENTAFNVHSVKINRSYTEKVNYPLYIFAPTLGRCIFLQVYVHWIFCKHIKCTAHLFSENLHNLTSYCDRIKSLYWTDWDQCISGNPSH